MFILKLSNSKPFHNTLNCVSNGNIEEVMKFYNLGDKTFETYFIKCTGTLQIGIMSIKLDKMMVLGQIM